MSLRIGSVPYLNARPLIYGIHEQVTLHEPSQLAALMHAGQIDVGLVPVAEVLEHDEYDIVDGIAIASRGPVRSVFLFHRVPLENLTRVAVDTASRSSAWLLRVILKIGYHLEPDFYPRPSAAKLKDHDAMLLIGDPAMNCAVQNAGQPMLDLGEAWQEMTGLPFVYAAWAVRRQAGVGPTLPQLLRRAKADGLAHLEEIVQSSAEATPDYRREYLTRHVWFELGDREKQGLRRYQQYCQQLGLIERCHDLRYIS